MASELHLRTIEQGFVNAAAFLESHEIAYGTDYKDAGDRDLSTFCDINQIACCCIDGAMQVGLAQAMGLESLADLFRTEVGNRMHDAAAEIAREHARATTTYSSHVDWNDGEMPTKERAIRFLAGCEASTHGYSQVAA